MDVFDQRFVGFNFLGFILKKWNEDGIKGEFILGFCFVGCLIDQLDDDLFVMFIFRVKDEVLVELQANLVI